MIPPFNAGGKLPPGMYVASWTEFVERFGTSARRKALLRGLKAAALELKRAGGSILYVGGSFVTSKVAPRDFDACWEVDSVDVVVLDPVILGTPSAQKAKYEGELFPALLADPDGKTFLDFFQTDRDGNEVGIIALEIGGIDD